MSNRNPENYKDFLDAVDAKTLVSDGAMGTELIARGVTGITAAANIDSGREKVVEIHLDYLRAGSDIIQTNTFAANPMELESHGLDDKTEEIYKAAALNARQAIEAFEKESASSTKHFIAGDVGPTGKMLKPAGDLDPSEAVDIFIQQISVLIESGVDLILIETMMDINEALTAIEAARSISDNIPLACTLTFGANGVTLMGNRADESIKILLDAGCDIVGANCSLGSAAMLDVVKSMREANPDARLMFQPNAGLPVLSDGKTVYNETPAIMAGNIKKYLEYKPSIIGGCCGSTPDHIREIASLL